MYCNGVAGQAFSQWEAPLRQPIEYKRASVTHATQNPALQKAAAMDCKNVRRFILFPNLAADPPHG